MSRDCPVERSRIFLCGDEAYQRWWPGLVIRRIVGINLILAY
jgi:hypothetical protein